MGDEPIQPQGAGRILGNLRWHDLGVRAAYAHGDPVRLVLGRLTPDQAGRATFTMTGMQADLSMVVGALIEIVIPKTQETYKVLEGEVGNLEGEGTDPTPPDDGGGHHH
jgi:hypothetical protein